MARFEPLKYPIALAEPLHIAASGWLHHVPFAMYLIDALRPGVFVELGVHHGVSYCAFCQAVSTLNTGTRCYGVDTWTGDIQAGFYQANVLTELQKYHDPLYSQFSSLMQMTFDEAADNFGDASVDLLHIDGCHTYEVVKHDFETWLSKMSGQGVIVLHDINLREPSFEVWKFWDEVKQLYPYFEFEYGYGLGVLAVGESIPPELARLIELSDEEKNLVHAYFYRLGAYVANLEALRAQQLKFEGERAELRQQVETQKSQVEAVLAQTETERQTENNLLTTEFEQRIGELHAEYEQYRDAIQAQHEKEIAAIYALHEQELSEIRSPALPQGFQYEVQFALKQIEMNQAHVDAVTRLQSAHEQKLQQQAEAYRQRYEEQLQNALAIVTNTRAWRMVQRWYRFKARVLPPTSRRARAYALGITSLRVVRRQGIGAFAAATFGWLFRGERGYHHQLDTPSVTSVPQAVPILESPQQPQPEVAVPQTSPLDPLREAVIEIMQPHITRLNTSLSILNWDAPIDVQATFPQQVVFSPPQPTSELPYLDKTVDVVVTVEDAEHLPEARRVARRAVVTVSSLEEVKQETLADDAEAAAPLPSISLILPSHNHQEYTENCLAQMLATIPETMDVEIIVVDDCSPEPGVYEAIKQWERRDARITVTQTEENMGYLMSCKRGAQLATKDIIVTLNNDILPQPGWIEALARTFVDYPDAGVVGGKLIYPNGQLQEAGGLAWQDGTTWNVGRLEDPDAPQFNFVRSVDYVSGCMMATPRQLWNEVGGYDEQFRPLYYEDTDYCFTVRERGYKVYYQPGCEIIHFEGVSSGVDVTNQNSLKRYQRVNQDWFKQKWKDALQSHDLVPPAKNLEIDTRLALCGSSARCPKRALISAPLLPEFDREGGSRRFFHMIQILQELGWSVSVLAANIMGGARYMEVLTQRGVAVFGGHELYRNPEMLLRAGQFELVISLFWDHAEPLLPLVREHLPNAKFVVDTIDLHFLRNARRVFSSDEPVLDDAEAREFRDELNVYYNADAVLAVSPKETHLINDFLTHPRAHYFPLLEELSFSPVPFEQRKGILLVGNFRHPPNVQAFKFMVHEILPKIDPLILRDHPLYVVGTDLPRFLSSYLDVSVPNVHLIGWVPSILPYFEQARVSVVPLLSGAGMKTKVLQALMVGLPTVSTSIGVEGMGLVDKQHVLIADDPIDFADAISKLICDADSWSSIRTAGHEHAVNEFSYQKAKEKFTNFLAALNL